MRWAVGELLHVLAERQGVAVWEHMREPILDSIANNFVSLQQPSLCNLQQLFQSATA